MEVGSKVTLTGITQKGKNRVREHGAEWTVVAAPRPAMCLNGATGVRITSDATGEPRWVAVREDTDFRVDMN